VERLFFASRRLFVFCFACAVLSILMQNGYAVALGLWLGAAWCLQGPELPHFTALLLFLGFLARLAVILWLHPPMESDFLVLYQASQSLLSGDLSFQDTAYFSLWAYQSPFVAWQAFWLSSWNDPLCLKLVNAALGAGTVCLLYRLVRPYVRAGAAQGAALCLTVFPFALTLPTLLSNQTPSAFFLCLALWLLFCPDCARLGGWAYPLAGLALQGGNLLRSEGIIVLAALLAWAIFEWFRAAGHRKKLIFSFALLLAVYVGAGAAADGIVRASGLNSHGTENGDPGWKFVTGLNFESGGAYSTADWELIRPTLDGNFCVTAETQALQRTLIAERLQAPPHRLIGLLGRKVRGLWVEDGLIWAFRHTQQIPEQPFGPWTRASAYQLLRQTDRGLFFAAAGLALLGLWPKSRWQRRPAAAYVPYFLVFAAFCAFLVVEVQSRYAYLPQLFLFAAASFGLDRFSGGQPAA